MLKVRVKVINEGRSSQEFHLTLAEIGNEQPLPFAPRWKTKKGAMRYAQKRGYEVID